MPLLSTTAAALVSLGIGSATAAAIAPMVLSTVASVGLTLASNALAPADAVTEPGAVGVENETSSDTTHPRTFAVGTFKTGGSSVYAQVSDIRVTGVDHGGTPQNRYLDFVFALADHRTDSLIRIWNNDRPIPVTGDPTAGGNPGWAITPYTRGGIEHGWIKLYIGNQSAADVRLVAASTLDPLGAKLWNNDCILTEVTYCRITLKYNERIFKQWPQFAFLAKGAKFYDITKDPTEGGTGAHVLGTQNTWEFTEYPAVMLYHIMSGYNVNGIHYVGLQGSLPEHFDKPSFIAAINSCNDNVALKAGGTEKRYKAGYEFTVDTPNAEIIETLLSGMAGRLCFTGTRYRLFAGVAQASVASFTDDDVIISEAREYEPKHGLADLVNKITGEFVDSDRNWNTAAAQPRTSTVDQDLDGSRILTLDLPLHMVQSNTQAQRIMEIARRQARRMGRHRVCLPMKFLALEAGDWVTWTSTKWGYTNKTFWVEGVEITHDLKVFLNLAETDSTVFAWNENVDELNTRIVDLPTGGDPSDVSGISLAITAFQETGSNGDKTPGLSATWTDPDNRRIEFMRIQWRMADGGAFLSKVFEDRVQVDALRWDTTRDIRPSTNYLVRAIPVTRDGDVMDATLDWSAVTAVTSLARKIKTPDIDDDQVTTVKIINQAVNEIYFVSQTTTPDNIGAAFASVAGMIQNIGVKTGDMVFMLTWQSHSTGAGGSQFDVRVTGQASGAAAVLETRSNMNAPSTNWSDHAMIGDLNLNLIAGTGNITIRVEATSGTADVQFRKTKMILWYVKK